MALQAHMRTSLTQEQKWDLCGKARRHRAIKPSGAVYGLQSIWPTKKPEIRTCSLYADTSDEAPLNDMPMGSKTFSKWDAIGRKRYRAWLWNKRCSSRYAGGTMRGHRKATLCCMALGEIGAHPSNGACRRPRAFATTLDQLQFSSGGATSHGRRAVYSTTLANRKGDGPWNKRRHRGWVLPRQQSYLTLQRHSPAVGAHMGPWFSMEKSPRRGSTTSR